MILKSLVRFADYKKVLSKEFEQILAAAFSQFFSNHITNEKAENIGAILFYSMELGFIKNPQEELKNVIPICRKVFDSDELTKNVEKLSNFNYIGGAFVNWNYNPGLNFFSSYFKAIEKTYDRYKHKEIFCAKVLKNYVIAGLKFDEDEFRNASEFWKREMEIMAQHLSRWETDEILKLCVEKFGGNEMEIKNILSKAIFNHLFRNTDSFTKANVGGTEIISFTRKPSIKFTKSKKMDKIKYLSVCRQLVAGESDSISAEILNELPTATVTFENEVDFTKNVARKWWKAFQPKLKDILGYKLVHALFDFMVIDCHVNGDLSQQFYSFEHPAQSLALFALKDIKNESFTFP